MGKLVNDVIHQEYIARKNQKKALTKDLEELSFEGTEGYKIHKKLNKLRAELKILKTLKNAVIAEKEEENATKINKKKTKNLVKYIQ